MSEKFIVSQNGTACTEIYAQKDFLRAAELLAEYLFKITGAKFSITQTKGQNQIAFEKKAMDAEYSVVVKKDGVAIFAENDIKAGSAFFNLLERQAGCVYCTSDFEVIPQNPDLAFLSEEYLFNPDISYRDVYYYDYKDPIFAMKRQTVHAGYCQEDETPLWGWGRSSHTLQQLVGMENFIKHPEYACMRDGVRQTPKMTGVYGEPVAENIQPCLTNPDLLDIVCASLARAMEKEPWARFWSVSMADNMCYCECPECARVDMEEGSHMGTYIRFVNEVAKRFPQKIISTLAYTYTKKPPKLTRPEKNVNILLCNIESYRDKPIEVHPLDKENKNELVEWAKICKNVYYWDYCIQFKNLVSPFPNLRVLAPNIRFFAKNNVKSLFNQGNREKGGEFAELRGYMLAKLNCCPDEDDRAIMQEFLSAYYGAADKYILQYIDLMHNALEKSDYPLNIFGSPEEESGSFLTRELFCEYMNIFDKAENAVKGDERLLLNVQKARLPLYYAGIRISYGTHSEVEDMLAKFAEIADKTELYKVEEWQQTTQMFIAEQKARLLKWQ